MRACDRVEPHIAVEYTLDSVGEGRSKRERFARRALVGDRRDQPFEDRVLARPLHVVALMAAPGTMGEGGVTAR